MSKVKIKTDSFSEIWNRRKHKLLVLVLEARDIAKSPTDAYYNLSLGSQFYKSVTLKKQPILNGTRLYFSKVMKVWITQKWPDYQLNYTHIIVY